MIIYYIKRTKEVVNKIGWMKLKWKKISSVSDLGNIRMGYLESCLLVDTDREKKNLKVEIPTRGKVSQTQTLTICVSAEEILREGSGDVVGLPERLRGCSPAQLFDGVYRREGRL